jgi:hypothetical protein
LNAQIAPLLHRINELLLIGWCNEKRNQKSETTSLDTWHTQNYSKNTVYTFYRCASESQPDSLTRKYYRSHPKILMYSLPLLTDICTETIPLGCVHKTVNKNESVSRHHGRKEPTVSFRIKGQSYTENNPPGIIDLVLAATHQNTMRCREMTPAVPVDHFCVYCCLSILQLKSVIYPCSTSF